MATVFSISFKGDRKFLSLSGIPELAEKFKELFLIATYIEELDKNFYFSLERLDTFFALLKSSSEIVYYSFDEEFLNFLTPEQQLKFKSEIDSSRSISIRKIVDTQLNNPFLDLDTLSFTNFGIRHKSVELTPKMSSAKVKKIVREELKLINALFRVWFCDNLSVSFTRDPRAIQDRACFFCGKPVDDKNSKEHIIPDSFLDEWNLKNQKMNFFNGEIKTYSRLKVNAHGECNGVFGSRYEDKILSILRDIGQYEDELRSMHEHRVLQGGPDDSCSALLTAWFGKIFYGVLWYQIYQLNNVHFQTEEYFESILDNLNFELVRKSYLMTQGFALPSSIYYFKLKDGDLIPFDFGFRHADGVFWLKLKNDFFMIAISDGQLCYQFLNSYMIDQFYKMQESSGGNCFHVFLLSHLIAVKRNLPKSPSFMVSENSIFNMSLTTMSAKGYQINGDAVNAEADKIRYELLKDHLKLVME